MAAFASLGHDPLPRGIVVEDRGNLGVGGKRLYRIRVRLDDITEPIESSVPDNDLTLLAKAPARSRNGWQGHRE
jgi:hypothetical protein